MLFSANIAVCPSCGNEFPHDKVNGVSLVRAVNDIDSRKRMYTKLALTAIEKYGDLDQVTFMAIRKVIMDNFSDYNRDVQTILGLDDEVE